ncbi:MAG: hypothetical protein PUJ20_09410, partial [Bacteroidales bacterium]|nr:hypothetical protein [Bacteroidales bacterium]MDY4235907.1 hypothetical protein [Sodaliphilus sp.]
KAIFTIRLISISFFNKNFATKLVKNLGSAHCHPKPTTEIIIAQEKYAPNMRFRSDVGTCLWHVELGGDISTH